MVETAFKIMNTEEGTYAAITEEGPCVSYLLEERGTMKNFLPRSDIEHWIRMTRILSITAFCFSLALGVCVILVSLQGNSLMMLSSAFYYFFGGIGALVIAWRFRDFADDDLELGPTRDQMATTVIAGSFVVGGVTISLCTIFYLQLQIQIKEQDLVWLPLAAGFGGFLVIAALQYRASVQLRSKSTEVAAVYSAFMCVLSLGLMASHLILAYDIMEKKTWIFLDPVIADVVAVLSIAFGVKISLCDISGNHCWD